MFAQTMRVRLLVLIVLLVHKLRKENARHQKPVMTNTQEPLPAMADVPILFLNHILAVQANIARALHMAQPLRVLHAVLRAMVPVNQVLVTEQILTALQAVE